MVGDLPADCPSTALLRQSVGETEGIRCRGTDRPAAPGRARRRGPSRASGTGAAPRWAGVHPQVYRSSAGLLVGECLVAVRTAVREADPRWVGPFSRMAGCSGGCPLALEHTRRRRHPPPGTRRSRTPSPPGPPPAAKQCSRPERPAGRHQTATLRRCPSMRTQALQSRPLLHGPDVCLRRQDGVRRRALSVPRSRAFVCRAGAGMFGAGRSPERTDDHSGLGRHSRVGTL